jgi:outer membrane protein assembly factor BamB
LVNFASLPLVAGDFETEKLDNWPQWRGPLADGFAPHAHPPLSWDAKTNIQWKVAVPGSGDSTPIVWGDRIFLLTAIETDREAEKPAGEAGEVPGGNPFNIQRPTKYYKFVVLCYDAKTGELVWERLATEQVPHEGHHRDHGFASASPVTDGQHVFASFGSRGIYCYDMNGNLKWERDLGDQVMYRMFGEGTSPVLHDGTLIVNWDHEGESSLYALDAATGETKWQVPREEHTSWATPLVVEHGGRTQIVVNGGGKARGYDFKTGEVIWECGGQVLAIIPCPITYEGLVFCMSGYQGSAMFAIPLDAKGDITGTEQIVWSRDRDAPYCPSALLYDGKLYFTKSNSAILAEVDAKTGETIMENQRLPGMKGIYASPVAADGKIYITGRDGVTVVIAPGPELKVLATNKLDEPVDASPALVGDRIFIRGEEHLYCIGE